MDQEVKRRKRRRRVRRISKAVNSLSYVIMILGVSLILSTLGILVANDMFALIKDEQPVILDLDEAMTTAELADMLVESEVIQYAWAFKLYASLKGQEDFAPGTFEVSPGMDYGQIIDTLIRDVKIREEVTVTIPEGFNLRQIAQLLEDEGVCRVADFMETADSYKFAHSVLKTVPMVENRLEGYLFPDTYNFYKVDLKDVNVNQSVSVINKMLNNFVNKITPEMKAMMNTRSLELQNVLIVASLIEREAKVAGERTTISGVLYNRLNSNDFPYLEIDATILYALPEHKDRLSAGDLEIDSPYNTYKVKGLPPTAICNPGLSAILAAIQPEQHKFYYYVVDDLETGSHAFAQTYKQHQANVAAYQKKLAEQGS